MNLRNLALGLVILASAPAVASIYSTGYVSFEIPDQWTCKQFHASYVCHHAVNQRQKKEAMIIVTAKRKGPLDSFSEYESFLNKERDLPGNKKSTRITPSKKVIINGHFWVDGWHKNSEVVNYYTRYEVTVCCKDQLAILVTLSANVNHFQKYSKDFKKTIKSLRVNKNISKAQIKAMGLDEKMGNVAAYMGDLIDSEPEEDLSNAGSTSLLASMKKAWPLVVIPVALLLYVLKRVLGKKKGHHKKGSSQQQHHHHKHRRRRRRRR